MTARRANRVGLFLALSAAMLAGPANAADEGKPPAPPAEVKAAAAPAETKPATAPAENKPVAAPAAEKPVAISDIPWDAALFAYQRPERLVVEETTPTGEQVAIWSKPPKEAGDVPAPKATDPALPREVGPMNVIHLRFRDATGDIVPAILCTPKGKTGPFPVVIAIHGLTSNKAQVVVAQVGPALAARGFAILAADLPCHGERLGRPLDIFAPGKMFDLYRKAVIAQRQLIDWAETRPELNVKGGVALVGYSLGSWISSVAGPSDPRVRAMVLMVGGAWDIPAELLNDPHVAATDPRVSLPHFKGRPVLFLNAKGDSIVAPELSRRLFEAAAEPKTQIWYEGGHLLPTPAYQEAARWLAEKFGLKQEPDAPPAPQPI